MPCRAFFFSPLFTLVLYSKAVHLNLSYLFVFFFFLGVCVRGCNVVLCWLRLKEEARHETRSFFFLSIVSVSDVMAPVYESACSRCFFLIHVWSRAFFFFLFSSVVCRFEAFFSLLLTSRRTRDQYKTRKDSEKESCIEPLTETKRLNSVGFWV